MLGRIDRWALALFLSLTGLATQAQEFLPVEQAFVLQARVLSSQEAQLVIGVQPGHYLYRDRTELRPLAPQGGAALDLPAGERKFDPNFNQEMQVWKHALQLRLPLQGGQTVYQLSYQGCAEAGLCYPPQRGELRVLGQTLQWQPEGGEARSLPWLREAQAVQAGAPAASAVAAAPVDEVGAIVGALRSGRVVAVIGLFFLLGLGLSFTPCVLPMMPILSSIIVGQQAPVSRLRGLSLALAYSLGMALVYTVLGVVAGLLGEGLAAALQNPWVLGAFALLLTGLALSMFDVWTFQMPAGLQARLQAASGRLPGGRFGGVFLMGGLSALMVGPCVAAPLAGALVYIGQSRDALLGAVALFSLAAGMSVPLLLLGLSAGTLLPRAGAWMERVKFFFGLLLLGVALWLVQPVLPLALTLLLLGGGALLGASLLVQGGALRRGLGLLVGLWGASLVLGALSGGSSLWQPLKHWGSASPAPAAAAPALRFERVADLAALDQALAQARQASRPVLLDFYADWCVSCKEMEHLTFPDPRVQARLGRALLLQADVTANTAADKALMRRYGLFGPPALLAFDSQGYERSRVIGFVKPEPLLARLASLGI